MPHQSLYKKIFTEDPGNLNPKEILQKITKEFPYFSLAHFFLLKETAANDFHYKKTAAKTALHFNNPFLLNFQLNRRLNVELAEELPEEKKTETVERIVPVLSQEIVPPIEIATASVQTEEVFIPEEIVENIAKPVEENKPVEAVAGIDKADQEETVVIPEVVGETTPVAKPDQEEMLFEPLYTTDYFASQGIKLSEEVQSGDKLGKQLRSFTDWLKTMKKVHQGKLPEGSAAIDQAVQNLAEKSNKGQEVLTEAMAEVFVQQGKAAKAREVYKKLSLLNPAKSAYFAAKIELLKEN